MTYLYGDTGVGTYKPSVPHHAQVFIRQQVKKNCCVRNASVVSAIKIAISLYLCSFKEGEEIALIALLVHVRMHKSRMSAVVLRDKKRSTERQRRGRCQRTLSATVVRGPATSPRRWSGVGYHCTTMTAHSETCHKMGRSWGQSIRGPASTASTSSAMKVLLMSALVALSAAKPRRVTPLGQWVTDAPHPDTRRPELPIDDHFEYRNPEVTDDGESLFESDMLLTAEQRDGRQASGNLWTSPVSFAISSSSSGDRAAILAGVQHWRDHTCIQFNEVAEGSSVAHINVIKSSGCWSYVGQITSSGGQSLSIGSGCTGLGTVVHEIGHAMGLSHQQSRHDRDTYVTILYENIRSGKEGNFNKKSTPNNYSVPYDLTSVMHYGASYFSSNGLDTIRVNNFLHGGLIGSRAGLSHRDKQIANAMYNCASS